MDPRLTVKIMNMIFENPLMPASGPLVEGLGNLLSLDGTLLGGLVTKTISREGAVVKKPCIVGGRHGIANSELWSEQDLDYWYEALDEFAGIRSKPLGVSVGYTADDLKTVIPSLEPFADFFEVSTHYNKDLLESIVRTARSCTSKPILIKLSPQVADDLRFVEDVLAYGADGIVAVNSFGPGLVLDLLHRRVRIGVQSGQTQEIIQDPPRAWISGPSVKPFALERIARLRRHFPDIVLIGCGGVENAQDVLEMVMAGADLVQMLSGALLHGRNHYDSVVSDLIPTMDRFDIADLASLRREGFSDLVIPAGYPKADNMRCTMCGHCIRVCPFSAPRLLKGHGIIFDHERCIRCGLCESLCPVEAIGGVLNMEVKVYED